MRALSDLLLYSKYFCSAFLLCFGKEGQNEICSFTSGADKTSNTVAAEMDFEALLKYSAVAVSNKCE